MTYLIILLALMMFSTFFSAAEASLMRLNRYKIEVDAQKNSLAKLTKFLHTRLDKVLTVILLGNTLANILLGSVLTYFLQEINAPEQWRPVGAPLVLTVIMLLFAEILPKTLATLKPAKIAYWCSPFLSFLMLIFYPFIWVMTKINDLMIKKIGIDKKAQEIISFSEYKLMVEEGMKVEQQTHHQLMMSVLELHELTVNDIMVARSKIDVLNLDDNDEQLKKQLIECNHDIMPVIQNDIENIVGIIDVKSCIRLILKNEFTKGKLYILMKEPYFIPEKTALHIQFIHFQQEGKKFALVVDEYGSLQGLITINDILDEIWVTDAEIQQLAKDHDITRITNNSWLLPGHLPLHTLKRMLGWNIPSREASTLSGSLIEYLECIPQPGACILINGVIYEVLQMSKNTIIKIKATVHE